MEIVDDGNMTLNIRLAALIQLKNNIQRRWLRISKEKDKVNGNEK